MHLTSKIFVLMATMAACVGATTSGPAPVSTLRGAELVVAAGSPAYALAIPCVRGEPVLRLNVRVSNHGTGASPALVDAPSFHPVQATDSVLAGWSGSASLPALAPGAGSEVVIPMPAPAADMAGTHHFTIAVKLNASAAPTLLPGGVDVTIPDGACNLPGSGKANQQDIHFQKKIDIAKPHISDTRNLTTHVAGQIPIPQITGTGNVAKNVVGHVPAATIAAPTGLTNTLDPSVCGQHDPDAVGGGFGCKVGLPAGMLALVWNSCSGCAADGFHLYRVDGGQLVLVPTPNNGGQFTLALLDKPPDGFNGKCYAVTAYVGTTESALSNAYCGIGGSVVSTATLQPTNVRSSHRARGDDQAWNVENSSSVAIVGFHYWTRKIPVGDDWLNDAWRSGILFDVSSFHNQFQSKHIINAKLMLRVNSTQIGADYHNDYSTSCTARIGVGTGRWWNNSAWIDAGIVLTPGQFTGPDVAYDVTPIVSDWAAGSPNFGFVLLGPEENLGAFTENSCRSDYDGNISLMIQYSG